MAKTARLELRVAPELLAQVDAARGDVSRTRWVERALEAALGGRGSGTPRSSQSQGSGSVKETAPTESPASSQGHAVTIKSEVFGQPPGPLKFTAEEEAAHAEAQRRLAARQLVPKGNATEVELRGLANIAEAVLPVPTVRRGSSVALERQARLNKAREKK